MIRTQGRWNPEHRGIYFSAGTIGGANMSDDQIGQTGKYLSPTCNLYAVNHFATPGSGVSRSSSAWRQFMLSLDRGLPTFLDSGIFFLTNVHKRAHNTTMDEALALAPEEIDHFSWLWDVYLELCSEFGDVLWGFNELDQGGRENKIRIRAKIEAEGLKPIPVYHPMNDGWDYFDDLAVGYDRICWGNLVQANRWIRMRLLLTAFERHRSYPDLFIHFLGLTPSELQAGLPFDSADSSTWSMCVRYPTSVKYSVMGKRALLQRPEFGLPMAYDGVGDNLDGSQNKRMAVFNMATLDYWSTQIGLGHWHAEVAETFDMERYPTS